MASLTLHNGDCLEVMKGIADKSIDLIICDLPYGCLTSKSSDTKLIDFRNPTNEVKKKITGCAWDIKIDLEAFWKQVKRIRKSDHSPTIHFTTTKFGYDLISSNPDEFRYDLVWDKQRGVSFLTANKMPMRSHEMIYIFSKKGAYYNRVDISGNFKAVGGGCKPSKVYGGAVGEQGSPTNEGKRCAVSVINISNSAKKGNHPTEKPEALYRFLIERYCPAGGTVLDPTFGSGNSVFTAYDMDYNAIGIEMNDVFYKKADERLKSLA